MGAQSRQERLTRLIEPVVSAVGLDLESVEVVPAGKRRLLRVVVDADAGVDLDTVGEVSPEISRALDASDVMGGGPYVLEVTSPGVDRPLVEPRHWRRSVGRLVRVSAHGEQLTGRVVGAEPEGVTLDVDGVSRVFDYSDLGRGQVQVEFGKNTGAGTGA
jgi:ribosome maturation factor RimP